MVSWILHIQYNNFGLSEVGLKLLITAYYSWLQLITVKIIRCKWFPEVYISNWATLALWHKIIFFRKVKMANYSWLQMTTADYSQLQLILTDVKGFLRSTCPIEQLSVSEVGLKWANYRHLQLISADYRWLQWILTDVYGFLRSTYPIEQLWFCEVRSN